MNLNKKAFIASSDQLSECLLPRHAVARIVRII